MKIALTPKFIDGKGCTNGDKPCADFFDLVTPGLCLRATSGKKSWGLVFTPPGGVSRTRMALGTYPATSLADARVRANAARGQVEAGINPATITAKPAGMTLRELVDLYRDKHLMPAGRPALRTAKEILRRLRHDVLGDRGTKLGAMGNLPVADFRKKHWYEIQDPMEDREVFVLCNRVFKDVRQMIGFAAARDLCEFNPMTALEMPFPDEETIGSRFLSVEEIKFLWHRMPKALVRSPRVRLILQIALATGKRSNELCGAMRAEIDWGTRIWTIPRSRVKGKDRAKSKEQLAQDEKVPLSDLAFALFQEAFRCSNSEYLFPDDDADGPYIPGNVSKCVRLALEPTAELPLGRLGMAKWTPHDLRRTVGTQMLTKTNGLNITKAQKYLALNHKTPDADDKEERNAVSDRVYDMNDYADDKRFALERWGAFLAALVGVETGLRVAA